MFVHNRHFFISCVCWVGADFGSALAALSLSLKQPELSIGQVVRVRGILTLTKDPHDQKTKQIKVLEFGKSYLNVSMDI